MHVDHAAPFRPCAQVVDVKFGLARIFLSGVPPSVSPCRNAQRLKPTAKPIQAEPLVAQLTVERFVRSSMPRLSGIDHRGADSIVSEPLQNRLTYELWTAIGAQVRRGMPRHRTAHFSAC